MTSNTIRFASKAGALKALKNKFIGLGIFLILIFSIFFLSACASEESKPADEDENYSSWNGSDPGEDFVRTNEGNGVWVDITWINPPGSGDSEEKPIESLIFEISKTTHQGDLLTYDLTANTRLIIDGEPVNLVSEWELTSRNSHHPEGMLEFILTGLERPESSITLVMEGLADVTERKFHWELAR